MFDARSTERDAIEEYLRLPANRENIDREFNATDLWFLYQMVAAWFRDRPLLVAADSDVHHIANFILLEFLEAQVEHNLEGKNHSVLDHSMEIMDALFVIFSAAINNNAKPDLHRVYTKINDIGQMFRGDSTYVRLGEIGGSIEPDNIKKPVELLIKEWMALTRNLPFALRAEFAMRLIIFKNGEERRGNYPSMYLGDENPYIKYKKEYFSNIDTEGQDPKLSPDEQLLCHDHVIKCLRYIRDIIKYIFEEERVLGLHEEDHIAFAMHILDFRNPEALEELKAAVYTKYSERLSGIGLLDWKEVDNRIVDAKKNKHLLVVDKNGQYKNGKTKNGISVNKPELITVRYEVGDGGLINEIVETI